MYFCDQYYYILDLFSIAHQQNQIQSISLSILHGILYNTIFNAINFSN